MPPIDSIGGSADGLTYIVTGPTRSALEGPISCFVASGFNLRTANLLSWPRSNGFLPFTVSVGLAVALAQRQLLHSCAAKHMV